MQSIDSKYQTNALTYAEYRKIIRRLLEKQQTSGPDQSPEMVAYTVQNEQRMKRLDKTTRLFPSVQTTLEKINQPETWLILTEAWCGDAAQIIPVLEIMSRINPLLAVRILFRDENPDLMDAFLTNGSRSIPRVIRLKPNSGEVLGVWGPRPASLQTIVLKEKERISHLSDPDDKKKAFFALVEQVHSWYAADKTKSIQVDFLANR